MMRTGEGEGRRGDEAYVRREADEGHEADEGSSITEAKLSGM